MPDNEIKAAAAVAAPIAPDSDLPTAKTGMSLPEWYPKWAEEVAELYVSGTTNAYVLHGNVHDLMPMGPGRGYGAIWVFLTEQLFGSWDLIFFYDLAKGLRLLAGRDNKRLREMMQLADRYLAPLVPPPKDMPAGSSLHRSDNILRRVSRDPTQVMSVLDRFVDRNVLRAEDGKPLRVAFIFDHASYLMPEGPPSRMSLKNATNVVTMLNWASSVFVKRLEMCFVMIDERLSALSERLTGNPHIVSVPIEMPTIEEREGYIQHRTNGKKIEDFSDYSSTELARLTAGVSLNDLGTMIATASVGGDRLDAERFRDIKKRLIERSCNNLLEFVEPKWSLDMVVGHEAAKERLREDAELLKHGRLDTLPMGYLFCGPVGTGKSFLAFCTSGSIGVPCVVLKNFRSKYVGETEGNLEMVLSVLRAMGPVVVIIDEADAALGNRESGGDSGTSSRVFAMIAAQMGDTRYRGKILWMLLTSRPDLLPIDIKRQGRAEVHIPLFYPQTQQELKDLFKAMSRKLGAKLDVANIPEEIPHLGELSGADVEGLVGRAWRRSLLSGTEEMTKEALQEALDNFLPSTQGLEKQLQETAAVVECTDRRFIPHSIEEKIEEWGGRAKAQSRLTRLKQLVEAM